MFGALKLQHATEVAAAAAIDGVLEFTEAIEFTQVGICSRSCSVFSHGEMFEVKRQKHNLSVFRDGLRWAQILFSVSSMWAAAERSKTSINRIAAGDRKLLER